MKINSYLTFDGNCEEAFNFYAQCLGGKIEGLMRFADIPCEDAQIPPGSEERIMHMRLLVGDQVLMGSDSCPMQPYEGIKGNSVALNLDCTDEGERIFNALAKGGTIEMPFEKTFWATRFGSVKDRFGVPWLINCEVTE
ncbi:VOC family protein [Pseudomonas sp. NPDC078700]|uniref:VOC family protein n=1 Tax=Pseudomonas sp. NPDC078700 TaxID=3364424 RepID=UPI0037CC02A6